MGHNTKTGELGRLSNVGADLISRFLRGKQGITFETACRLLEALELEIVHKKKGKGGK